MTDLYHPITPSPELIEDWIELAKPLPQHPPNPNELATLAAQWGADAELEACCAWLEQETTETYISALRATRRPKPPSLKEQALQAHHSMWDGGITRIEWELIRRALEQLDD
jgi:hypothetical protein